MHYSAGALELLCGRKNAGWETGFVDVPDCNNGARASITHPDLALELLNKGFDNAGPKASFWSIIANLHANSVVADTKRPTVAA